MWGLAPKTPNIAKRALAVLVGPCRDGGCRMRLPALASGSRKDCYSSGYITPHSQSLIPHPAKGSFLHLLVLYVVWLFAYMFTCDCLCALYATTYIHGCMCLHSAATDVPSRVAAYQSWLLCSAVQAKFCRKAQGSMVHVTMWHIPGPQRGSYVICVYYADTWTLWERSPSNWLVLSGERRCDSCPISHKTPFGFPVCK